MIVSVPFCPCHFVHTVLCIPFCTCPYHFVHYHFVLEPQGVVRCPRHTVTLPSNCQPFVYRLQLTKIWTTEELTLEAKGRSSQLKGYERIVLRVGQSVSVTVSDGLLLHLHTNFKTVQHLSSCSRAT